MYFSAVSAVQARGTHQVAVAREAQSPGYELAGFAATCDCELTELVGVGGVVDWG